MPARSRPTISSVVATGRRMNGSETPRRSWLRRRRGRSAPLDAATAPAAGAAPERRARTAPACGATFEPGPELGLPVDDDLLAGLRAPWR